GRRARDRVARGPNVPDQLLELLDRAVRALLQLRERAAEVAFDALGQVAAREAIEHAHDFLQVAIGDVHELVDRLAEHAEEARRLRDVHAAREVAFRGRRDEILDVALRGDLRRAILPFDDVAEPLALVVEDRARDEVDRPAADLEGRRTALGQVLEYLANAFLVAMEDHEILADDRFRAELRQVAAERFLVLGEQAPRGRVDVDDLQAGIRDHHGAAHGLERVADSAVLRRLPALELEPIGETPLHVAQVGEDPTHLVVVLDLDLGVELALTDALEDLGRVLRGPDDRADDQEADHDREHDAEGGAEDRRVAHLAVAILRVLVDPLRVLDLQRQKILRRERRGLVETNRLLELPHALGELTGLEQAHRRHQALVEIDLAGFLERLRELLLLRRAVRREIGVPQLAGELDVRLDVRDVVGDGVHVRLAAV